MTDDLTDDLRDISDLELLRRFAFVLQIAAAISAELKRRRAA